ncbi:MAG: efflux RND transporter periplasmic adaptor subunit, partial [Acetobacteraceae bacterium]
MEPEDVFFPHAECGVMRRVAFVAAALILAGLLLSLLFRGGAAAPPPAAPSVQAAIGAPVTPVVERTVPVYLEYIGTTTAIQQVTLEAQVTGYFMKPAVSDGADVKKGQVLYEIEPGPYQAALDQAKARALKDAAALKYAKANRERNSQMVKTGDTSVDAFQQATST